MALTKELTIVLGLIIIIISISSQDKISNDVVAIYIGNSLRSEMLSSENVRANNSKIVTETPNKSGSTSTNKKCSKYEKLNAKLQPKPSNIAKLKKCCPFGESYQRQRSNYTEDLKCKKTPNVKFEPDVKEVLLYDGCVASSKIIKDDYNYAIGIPCDNNRSEYSAEFGDMFYVIQNGSLLTINANKMVEIFDEYCLDNIHVVNPNQNFYIAIVCNHVQTLSSNYFNFEYLYASCMLASVPCLLLTVLFYFSIPRLSNIHGKSLACHSLCSAIACLFFGVAKLKGEMDRANGLTIQYFFLSCFLWLFIMCFDVCVHLWYFIPQKITITPKTSFMRIVLYGIIAFGIPVVLVCSTASNKIDGVPSYYFNGQIDFQHNEATRYICQFFMTPILTVSLTSFALLVAAYFGIRKLNSVALNLFFERTAMAEDVDVESRLKQYTEVKQSALSTAFLCIITVINRSFSIISFYMEFNSSIDTFDILNAVHGMVVFIIFVCRPQPMAIIRDWWYGRKPLALRSTEIVVFTDSDH